MNCFYCRDGKSLVGKDVCEKCGRTKEVQVVTKEWTNEMYIPKHYREISYRKEVLTGVYFETDKIVRYAEQLQSLEEQAVLGARLTESYFIISPVGFAKTTLAYSMIQKYFKAGYSVSKLMDIAQFKMEYRKKDLDSSENPINKDILFLKAKDMDYRYVMQTIEFILDYRARKELPTVILSELELHELSVDERITKSTYTQQDNKLRYPNIICL